MILAVLVAAAWLSAFHRAWMEPILEAVIDGDRTVGGFVGFGVGVVSLGGATFLWSVAGPPFARRKEATDARGWLLRAGAVVVGSMFFVGFTGRGPLTGDEEAFNEIVPGYQGGTTAAFIAGFLLGIPIYMGFWSRYERRRREAEGLPVDKTHPVMVVLQTAGLTVGMYAVVLLAAVAVVGVVIGAWALITRFFF